MGHRLGEIKRRRKSGRGPVHLTPAEREELQGLVAQYEHLLLQNTKALLRATRPDLVDASGRISRARLTHAARRTANVLRQSNRS